MSPHSDVTQPLNEAQSGIWFAQQADPSNSAFNNAEFFEFFGSLDTHLFEQALVQVTAEAQTLRLGFLQGEDGPRQYVRPDGPGLERLDLSGEPDPREAALAWMAEEAAAPLDVLQDELARSVLFTLGPEHHLLYRRYHHLITDGYTTDLLANRLARVYSALRRGESVPGSAFAPIAELMADARAYSESDARRADEDYWRARLAGAAKQPGLAGVRRPADRTHVRSSLTVSEERAARIKAAARQAKTGWQQMLLTAVAVYTQRCTGREEVLLSLPVTARRTPLSRSVPGMMSNVIPLRCEIGPDIPVAEAVAHVSVRLREALRHQRYPVADIRRMLGQTSDARAEFGPIVNLMSFGHGLDFDGLSYTHRLIIRGEVEDLRVNILQQSSGGALEIDFDGNPRIYSPEDLAAHRDRFDTLLDTLCADTDVRVGDLDPLPEAERDLVVEEWNDSYVPVAELTVHEVFEEHARNTPDATAVVFGAERTSYGELDARANRLARYLGECGVARGDVVGVLLERGTDLAVAVLGVLKAGGTYLLLDPGFPEERLATLVTESGTTTVLSRRADHDRAASLGGRRGVRAVDVDASTGDGDARPVRVLSDPADGACVMFTSGSTGVPKGVLAPHRALVGTFLGQGYVDLGPGHVWLQCAPVSWDGFVLEFWGALLSGAVCVLQPERSPEPARIAGLVAEQQVTTLWLSAGLFNLLLDEYPSTFAGVRQVMTGGEAPSVAHLRRFRESFPDVRLVHGYGPAESMIFTHTHVVEEVEGDALPVGGPVGNKRGYVLDARLRPVGVGMVGELYVSGVGLGHGYVGRPGATAERFLPDPFGDPGSRMYRTGDLARWTRGGELVLAGRADDQVKIRGFRVEPGEVETALTAVNGIAQAVVVHGVTTGEHRLAAYVVAALGAAPTPGQVLAAVSDTLPEHMVPSAVVILPELPLTPNGKVDRRALPAPDFSVLSAGRAPRDAREEILCGLFADLLGLESVTIDDSFFDLGGHSLLAARLISRIGSVFGVEPTLREVFTQPTVVRLAEHLAASTGTTASAPRPALVPVVRPERVPLSYAQRRLWFLDQLQGPSSTYNIPVALRFEDGVDARVLAAALGDMVERHEALRTVFVQVEGEPYQSVLEPGVARAALVLERGAGDEGAQDTLAGHRFDLSRDLPLRARLVEHGESGCTLHLVLHHVAGDGSSMGPLLRDLAEAYQARLQGRAPCWEPLPVQYADHTLWQLGLLGDAEDPESLISRQTEYWRRALSGAPEELALPLDRPRTADPSHRGGAVDLPLPEGFGTRIADLARENRCTPHMVLQAALAVTLDRMGAGSDIPIGTPVAGRTDEVLDDLVGFFVNTLVMRTDTSGDPSFAELLARVRERTLADLEHQDVPFDHLVEKLNPARSTGRNPLFQVMLTLEQGEEPTGVPGARLLPIPQGEGPAKFDLSVTFAHSDERLTGRIGYATDLFEQDTVARIGAALVRVLEHMAQDVDASVQDVEVLSEEEYALVVRGWNGTDRVVPDLTVPQAFELRAERDPLATAVVFGAERTSYGELDARANRLARYLGECGVARGDVVGVLLERGTDLAVAVLGVLKAGGTYLLLDPGFPDERLATLVTESGAGMVVTREEWAARVVVDRAPVCVDGEVEAIASQAGTAPELEIDPADGACVMFTSGSTGVPKGVLAPHRALVGTFLGQGYVDLGPGHVWLQCAPVSWDGFVLEFWGALLSGAVCVLQPERSPEPARIAGLVAEQQVTTLWLSAGLFNLLLDEYPSTFAGVRQVMTGGEAPSVAHLRRFRESFPDVRLVHGYGPAESMIFTNATTLTSVPEGRIPVGGPLANKRCFVLDARLRPLPVGMVGELYVSGVGLAHGYAGRPTATAERFVANPHGEAGARMYRTGDLARWTRGGELVLAGRADDQVKIRGFRVEPGEVETALNRLPEVSAGVVTVREDQPGDRKLVGYAVLASEAGAEVDPVGLRRSLAAVLPEHMVPSVVVVLESLPLNGNGKVDRRALPAPDFSVLSAGRAPRDAREEILCGLFADLLGLESVTIDDSFFDLGGHSLLATRLVSRIRSVQGVELTLKDLFQAPTVAELAVRIAAAAPAKRARPKLVRRTREDARA